MEAPVDEPRHCLTADGNTFLPNRRRTDLCAAVVSTRAAAWAADVRRPRSGTARAGVPAEKCLTAVMGHRRVVGAEEELALTRRRQALGDVQVDPAGAAARLLVEMREPSGDVAGRACRCRQYSMRALIRDVAASGVESSR